MQTGKIDIHQTPQRLELAISRLKENALGLSEKNIQLIIKFCNDCLLGKTVLKKAKKRITPGRVVKYLYTLKQIAFWLKADLDQVSQEQMEELIRKIDGNQLKYFDAQGNLVSRSYTEWTRHDLKVTVKKFY